MSKGNPAVKVRLPAEEIARIKAIYKRINLTREEEPYVMSTFLVSCIRHRIKELERQARYRRKKKQIRVKPDLPGKTVAP